MPFGPLHARLKALTFHRVLRADEDEQTLNAAGVAASANRWAAFRPQFAFSPKTPHRDPKLEKKAPKQPLYVDYTIPC